jgi:hypothetical protein
MVEACPTCDTLWRLYSRAVENLQDLSGKHRDARDKGDQNGVDVLAHEITIAESALPVVRREIRRHHVATHGDRQSNQKQQPKSQLQNQK